MIDPGSIAGFLLSLGAIGVTAWYAGSRRRDDGRRDPFEPDEPRRLTPSTPSDTPLVEAPAVHPALAEYLERGRKADAWRAKLQFDAMVACLVARGWSAPRANVWSLGGGPGAARVERDEGAVPPRLVAHIPYAAGHAGILVGPRDSGGQPIGDPEFDARVGVVDVLRGRQGRLLGWLSAPVRTSLAALVADGWSGTSEGWERTFAPSSEADSLATAIEAALARVAQLPAAPPERGPGPLVERALQDPAPGVRLLALTILADVWPRGEDTRAAALALFGASPDDVVTRRVLAGIARVAALPVEPELLAWLGDDDELLRVTVVDALAVVGTAASVEPLRRALERPAREPATSIAIQAALEAVRARLVDAPRGGLALASGAAGDLALAASDEPPDSQHA